MTKYSAFSIKERLDAGDTVPATFYAAADYNALARRLKECEGALQHARQILIHSSNAEED